MERVVVDGRLPSYQRFYAWAKLLRHWCSLRWDDGMGVKPEDLRMRARGLFGLLQRSKTSGPDKKVKLLPIFGSRDAWLEDSTWLATGLHFLQGEELGYARDYLVPLPNESLDGSCGLRAQYLSLIHISEPTRPY